MRRHPLPSAAAALALALACSAATASATSNHEFVVDGVLPTPTSEVWAGYDEIRAVVAVDLDHDGDDDLVALLFNRLWVHLADGDGGYAPGALYPIPGASATGARFAGFLAPGDFNADGYGDVLVTRGGDDSVFLGGPGGIGRWIDIPASPLTPVATAPIVVDLDRDGHQDWLVNEAIGVGDLNEVVATEIAIYLGDGTGGVRERIGRPHDGGWFTDWDAGDLDGDGAMDLAVASTNAPPRGVFVLHGDGGTGFADPVIVDDLQLPDALEVVDIDGDGRDDIVTSPGFWAPYNGALLYLQQPDGTLAARPETRAFSIQAHPTALFGRDVDLDGIDDLITLDPAGWRMVPMRTEGGDLVGGPFLDLPKRTAASVYFDADDLAFIDPDRDDVPDLAISMADTGIILVRGTLDRYSGDAGLPGAPTIVGFTDGTSSSDVTFTAPADDGGEPIIGYRVSARRSGGDGPYERHGGVSPALTQLVETHGGTGDFDVIVRAVTAAGFGPPSAPVTHRVPSEGYGEQGLWVSADPAYERDVNRRVAWVQVWLGSGATEPVTFDVATRDGTATAGEDYTPVALTDVVIPEGQRGFWLGVPMIDDDAAEPAESFHVDVTRIRGAVGKRATLEIELYDDDALPAVLSLSGGIADEGTVADGRVPLMAELMYRTRTDVALSIELVDGTATAGADYRREPIRLVIPAGQTRAFYSVALVADAVPEAHESFTVRAVDVTGMPDPGVVEAVVEIDDDDIAGAPPMFARDDRYEVRQNAGPVRIDPFANDVFDAARFTLWGTPTVSAQGEHGQFSYYEGDRTTMADDVAYYTPDPDFTGTDRTTYRFCEEFRCAVGTIDIVVRPLAADGFTVDAAATSGHADLPMTRLPPLPDARLRVTPLVLADEHDVALPVDATPQSPWDGGGTDTRLAGIEAGDARDVRVLVELVADGEADLYVGLDDDGDGVADRGETRCTSARTSPLAQCELALTVAAGASPRYWIRVHNRDTRALAATLSRAAVPLVDGDGTLRVTGPGHLHRGDASTLRVGWNEPALRPGERRVAYVGVASDPGTPTAWTPVRLDRTADAPAARALADGRDATLVVAPGASERHVFVDVPEGATSLVVESRSTANVDLHLAHVPAPTAPAIAAAPPVSAAVRSATTPQGDERVELDGATLQPGRWYVTVENRASTPATVTLRADITAVAPVVRPGSYFNPARGGHGLVVYPAADQWAALWYTYFQDGSPTWLYLQAPAPGPDGLWTAPIHRTAWNGVAQHMVPVGIATLTPTGPDAFTFTYTLDGETGSEPMQSLGRGCPTVSGAPLDASSNWFDARRAGTGYSVQLWPDYEMHLAFVYDAQGVPRFLIAEGGFGGAERVLALEQLQGFCPLCERLAAPARRDIGTYLRRFGEGALRVGIDGFYGAPVPGWWTADDDARPLGGPTAVQGCAP